LDCVDRENAPATVSGQRKCGDIAELEQERAARGMNGKLELHRTDIPGLRLLSPPAENHWASGFNDETLVGR
jgi:hypothetical protein